MHPIESVIEIDKRQNGLLTIAQPTVTYSLFLSSWELLFLLTTDSHTVYAAAYSLYILSFIANVTHLIKADHYEQLIRIDLVRTYLFTLSRAHYHRYNYYYYFVAALHTRRFIQLKATRQTGQRTLQYKECCTRSDP